MSTTKRCYYDVLEVTRSASAEEIKKSFRKKAKECHPDTNKSPEAEAQFKELGEAYDVLSDANKRQVYDNYGHDGLKSGGYQPGWDFADGFPDLGDIFSSFFGGSGFGFGGGGSRSRHGPRQGDDLRLDLPLEFNEAAFGAKKEITITHMTHCEPCNGQGSAQGSGPSTCSTCGGKGQVQQVAQTIIGHFTQITTCPQCQGQGRIITNPCGTCHGQGRAPEEKSLTLTIPAGVDQGTRLRISGEGDSGYLGGPPGDLYVVLNVKPHPVFKRDGYDIHALLEVSYAQMALGDELDIPTLEGDQRLKIPAGTETGHVFSIKGVGVPHLNNPKRKGDHYVQVEIAVPKHVSGEEKKLLSRLLELEQERAKKSQPNKSVGPQTPSNKSKQADLFGKFKEAIIGS